MKITEVTGCIEFTLSNQPLNITDLDIENLELQPPEERTIDDLPEYVAIPFVNKEVKQRFEKLHKINESEFILLIFNSEPDNFEADLIEHTTDEPLEINITKREKQLISSVLSSCLAKIV